VSIRRESNRDLISDYGDPSSTRRSDFILDRRIHRQSSDQPPVLEEAADAMSTRNSGHAAASAHPDSNGHLRETFQRWWPAMTPISAPALS